MHQQRRLVANHLDDARMRVPQGVHADAGDEVQVAVAVDIVHVASLAAMDHDRIAGVILKKVLAFQVHHILGGGVGG